MEGRKGKEKAKITVRDLGIFQVTKHESKEFLVIWKTEWITRSIK